MTCIQVVSILTQNFLLPFSPSTGTTGNGIHHFAFLKATEINYVKYYHRRYINQNRRAEQLGISESPKEILCHWRWWSFLAQTKSCVLKRGKKNTPTEPKHFSYYFCMTFITKWKIIIPQQLFWAVQSHLSREGFSSTKSNNRTIQNLDLLNLDAIP